MKFYIIKTCSALRSHSLRMLTIAILINIKIKTRIIYSHDYSFHAIPKNKNINNKNIFIFCCVLFLLNHNLLIKLNFLILIYFLLRSGCGRAVADARIHNKLKYIASSLEFNIIFLLLSSF